jgi:branched-chain amino acid transport system permease protein
MFGWTVASPLAFAVFASAVAGLCALVLWRLKRSPWGRLLIAMREDELATRGLGKNTRLAKVHAFAISSALVAIAGALYAAHVRYLDPSSASLDESILMLSMVIVGGLGNFRGPLVGAFVLIALPEVLRFFALPDAQAANLRLLIYGLLLILMMHFRPQGIAGEYRVQ